MKRIVKDHGEFAQGKVFDKPATVALLGTNLRFRVAARATASTSNRDDIQAKFQSFAVLDSVPESVFQEITDEYNAMVRKRFEVYSLFFTYYGRFLLYRDGCRW